MGGHAYSQRGEGWKLKQAAQGRPASLVPDIDEEAAQVEVAKVVEDRRAGEGVHGVVDVEAANGAVGQADGEDGLSDEGGGQQRPPHPDQFCIYL